MDNHWLDRAACHRHPILDPDAWFDVVNGRPQGQGARAMMVCRRACPVMLQCRAHHQEIGAWEAIVGGGWYDNKGKFHEPENELLDVHQAAAYLGIDVGKLRRLMGTPRLPIASHRQGKAWFRMEDLVASGVSLGPPHGSLQAHQLHELKGEVPCRLCRATQSLSEYVGSGARS